MDFDTLIMEYLKKGMSFEEIANTIFLRAQSEDKNKRELKLKNLYDSFMHKEPSYLRAANMAAYIAGCENPDWSSEAINEYRNQIRETIETLASRKQEEEEKKAEPIGKTRKETDEDIIKRFIFSL